MTNLNESLPNTLTPEERSRVKELMSAFLKDKKTWIDRYGLEQANFVMYKTAIKKAKNENGISENLKNNIKDVLKEILKNDSRRTNK